MKKGLFLSVLFIQQLLFAQAPDFTVTDNQGEVFVLSETLNNGQLVLIDFLATWCGPCADGVSEFSEIYHHYGCNSADLVVLSMSLDGTDYDTQVFHNLYGGDHPIISGLDGGGAHVHEAYGVESLPYYVLVDSSGSIVFEGNEATSYESLNDLLFANGLLPDDCQILDFTQSEELHQGWNLLSKRVVTENESMEDLFTTIADEIIILKDAAGNVYWPAYNLNTIGDFDSGKGYLAKFSTDLSVSWTGELIPSNFAIPLNSGWNIMPYYAEDLMSSSQYFSSIASSIVIVKDELGNAYLPSYNFNNIGSLQNGKGYYIKVSESLTFQY